MTVQVEENLNEEIAKIFRLMATLSSLAGDNRFRIEAYSYASNQIEYLGTDLRKMISDGSLLELDGIGQAIFQKIQECFEVLPDGSYRMSFNALDAIRKNLPTGIELLFRVNGIGPARVRYLWTEMSITNLDGLETALQAGIKIKGITTKKVPEVLDDIKRIKANTGRFNREDVTETAETLLLFIKSQPGVIRADITGSYRRKKTTVKDIDIICSIADGHDPMTIAKAFAERPEVTGIRALGNKKASIVVPPGIQVDLRVIEDHHYPTLLHHFTGSKNHNVRLRTLALSKGMKISEYGVFKVVDGEEVPLKVESEADIYQLLGLEFISPEGRED